MSSRTFWSRSSSALMAALATSMLVGGAARADGSSIFTLGVGGGVGMRSEVKGPKPESSLVNTATVRLKMLHFLGVDFGYDLQRDDSLVQPAEDLQLRAKMRLTALLYPYSGESFAFYLGAGLGATRFSELKTVSADGNSYHAGVGLEVHATSHLSFDLSFMVVIPGAASIKRTTVADVTATYQAGGQQALLDYQVPTIDRFVSIDNHEIMLRVLLFL